MGTESLKAQPYNMSGLLIMCMEIFMIFIIGIFEGVCVISFEKQKWNDMCWYWIICFFVLWFSYFTIMETYRIWESVFKKSSMGINKTELSYSRKYYSQRIYRCVHWMYFGERRDNDKNL